MTKALHIPYGSRRQAGLSLVELMIAMTIGLLIVTGVVTIFVNTSNTREELEKTSRQIENGRYAMQLLSEDLQMAGYLGEYVPPTSVPAGVLPDICATDLATLTTALLLHVQGVDDAGATPSCVSDRKSGTDIIVIRRASTCTAANPAETDCDAAAAGAPYLQVSGCSTDTDDHMIDTTIANLTLKKVGCTSTASLRRFRTHIYFIANNNMSSDGIPTLKRAELGAGGFSIVPLVEGIEQLQIEYGIDTAASPGDGVPDTYTDTPLTLEDWWSAMSARVYLLARNETTSGDYTDKKTYVLGGTTYGPFGDNYRRSAYSAAVKMANPSGRRE